MCSESNYLTSKLEKKEIKVYENYTKLHTLPTPSIPSLEYHKFQNSVLESAQDT